MDRLTAKIVERLRDHENHDCTGDGGCYTGELAGEAAEKIEDLYEVTCERYGAEHYGTYGTACMNTGQFDAGECWLCYAKRMKREAADMQLIAGRWQYLFELADKLLTSYATSIDTSPFVDYKTEVAKIRKSPTEKKV